MDILDDILYKDLAKISLDSEVCLLKHNDDETHPAVNYLCQMFGDGDVVSDLIRIPICEECEEALQGNDWVLFYCLGCNSSQWVLKEKAKRTYQDNKPLYFFINCPICYEE